MSLYDKASTALLASGAAGKGGDGNGTIYNLKPEEKLKATELITNGGFDTDSDWIKTSGVTISGGKARMSDTSDVYRRIEQQDVFTVGKTYRVSVNLVVNLGTVKIGTEASANSIGLGLGSGQHSFYFTADANDLYIAKDDADNGYDIEIDNVSVKEVEQEAADFNLNRGANIGATRVAKDGLIEKGREQLLVNTVFAGLTTNGKPTNYNDSFVNGTGSLSPLASDSTKVKFEVTDASGGRFYLNETVSNTNLICTSVFVDEVTGTAPEIRQIVRSFSSNVGVTRTIIFAALKDGEVVSDTDTVVAGHRYGMVCSYDGSSVHRFGLGTNQSFEAVGSVTLSQPQIEAGLTPTAYIENTSTSATAKAGILVDEPRFDYTGGGCPKLLLEPTRANKLPHSEYFGTGAWVAQAGITLTTNTSDVKSPEGLYNATKVVSTDAGDGFYKAGLSVASDVVHSIYLRGASGGETLTLQDSSGYPSPGGQKSITLTDEWVRYDFPIEYNGENVFQGMFVNNISVGTIYAWGAQMEEGASATSYIPTYGTSATRDADVVTNLAIPEVNNDEYTFFVHDVNGLEENGNRGPRLSDQTSGAGNDALMGYYVQNGQKNFFCYTDTGSGVKAFPNHSSSVVDAKYAFTVDNVNLRVRGFVNGELIGDGTPAVTTEPTHITMASSAGDPNEIHQIIYFPTVLSNTEVKILTGATSYVSFGAMTDALTNYTTYE